MAYLHEQRLGDAIKRLYMLGSSDKKKDQTTFEGGLAAASGGVRSAVSGAQAKAAAQKLQSDNAFKAGMREAAGAGLDYSGIGKQEPIFINQPSLMRQYDINHASVPQMQSPKAPDLNTFRMDPTAEAQQALENNKQNQALENMPIGGVYTASGLRNADKEATLNAQDRMRSRALIGQGMAMSTPYPQMASPAQGMPGTPMTPQQRAVSNEADNEMDAYKFGLSNGPSVGVQ